MLVEEEIYRRRAANRSPNGAIGLRNLFPEHLLLPVRRRLWPRRRSVESGRTAGACLRAAYPQSERDEGDSRRVGREQLSAIMRDLLSLE